MKLIALLFVILFFGNLGGSQSSAPTLDAGTSYKLFMQIDGIQGSSVDANHKDWSDILSYEWGVLSASQTHVGAGQAAPQTIVSDFFVTKNVDKASPGIVGDALKLTSIKKVEIEVVKAAGPQYITSVKFTLENCIVSSYYQTGSAANLYETLSFAFQKLTYTYTPELANGNPGTPIQVQYDYTKP